MRKRTLIAAVVGLVVALLAFRFARAALWAGMAATGLSSAGRTVFTVRAFYYITAAASGFLAIAGACATFLAVRGKWNAKRWKRGLWWAFPAFLVILVLLPRLLFRIGVPAATIALLLATAVSMFAASR